MADWITAWATLATALATTFGGFSAWMLYRYTVRRDDLVIEREILWQGGRIHISLFCRNQRSAAIDLAAARLRRPRGSQLFWQPGAGSPAGPVPTGAWLPINLRISPKGTAEPRFFAEHGQEFHLDTQAVNLYASPSPAWRKGWVVVDLNWSSAASNRRQQTTTVKRFVKAPTMINKDEIASSQG